MKILTTKTTAVLLTIVTVIFLFLLLFARFELGQLRYFDADELAYLHWAHNIFTGKLPYIDFFFYVPPGFIWFLAPLFLFAKGTAILSVSRIVAFGIFVFLCVVSGLLLKQMRKQERTIESFWVLLLPAVILVFLPLPADKLLEIRPDTIATVAALVGLYLQIRWFESEKRIFAWWSGVLYAVSLLLLPKSLPQIVVAVVVACFASSRVAKRLHQLLIFLVGIGLPLGMFGVWILLVSRSIGDLQVALYSLTKLPLEVNKIGQLFPMQPDLFFYPNNNYYGIGGWSRGLIANHVVWVIGLLFGMGRFVTPWIGGKNKIGAWTEVLVGGSFLAYIVTFMYGYPLRHAQYLIPIAVFVSLYVADMIWLIWESMRKKQWERGIFVVGYILCVVVLWRVSIEVNKPKRLWTNAEDVRTLEFALQTIPKDSYVLDLVGATIYFRDPAYGCCLPFGQYTQFLTKPLPSITQALSATRTRYIYQGRLERVNDLDAADRQYITTNFTLLPQDTSWFRHK